MLGLKFGLNGAMPSTRKNFLYFLFYPCAKKLAKRNLAGFMGDTDFNLVVVSAEALVTRIYSCTFFFQLIKTLANNSDPAARSQCFFSAPTKQSPLTGPLGLALLREPCSSSAKAGEPQEGRPSCSDNCKIKRMTPPCLCDDSQAEAFIWPV